MGTVTTTADRGAYFVEIDKDKTFAGITPERSWYTVTIVFPKNPGTKAAYDAMYAEAQKLVADGLDMHLSVQVGDKNVPTSWQDIKDKDGDIFANYDAETKKLERNGNVLKRF